MAADSADVHFAQKLAANDKPTRDKAIKRLRKWLSSKGKFTEVELLKIWKGLHYCMWMQDKPLLQEELADNISQLVHVFNEVDLNFLFVQTFLQTEAREWSSIDRWRVDKFMMLVRRIMRQSLLFIKNKKWKKSHIKSFVQILTDHVIKSVCDGLKIHVADIYMEELEMVGADVLSTDQTFQLLMPFMSFLPTEQNIAVVKRVINRIFTEAIIKQTVDDAMVAAERQIQKEEGSDSETEDNLDPDFEDGDTPPRLKFDFEKIADRLFELGSRKDCIARNRQLIYDVVKKLHDLNEGILPMEEDVSDVDEGGIDKKDIAQAVRRLEALENVDKGGKKNLKQKKKKKKTKNAKVTDNDNELHANNLGKENRKRKLRDSNDNTKESDSTCVIKKKISTEHEESDVKSPKKKQKKQSPNENESTKDSSLQNNNFTSLKESSNKEDNTEFNDSPVSGSKKAKHKKQKQLTSTPRVGRSNCHSDNLNFVNSPEHETSKLSGKKSKKRNISISESMIIDRSDKSNVDKLNNSKENSPSVKLSGKKSKNNKRISLSESTMVDSSDKSDIEKLNNSAKVKNIPSDEGESETPGGKKKKRKMENDKTSSVNKVEKENTDIKLNDSVSAKKNKTKETVAGSPFAQFEKLKKSPPAFVRKAVAKLSTPKTEPRKKKGSDLITPPGSAPLDRRKSVSFDMKSNTTLDFHKDVHLSPATPFNPRQRPESSILKSSPLPSSSKIKGLNKKGRRSEGRSTPLGRRRASAADFF